MPRQRAFPKLCSDRPLKVGDMTLLNVPLAEFVGSAGILLAGSGSNLWRVNEVASNTCSCNYKHGCDRAISLTHKKTGYTTAVKCWGFGDDGFMFILHDPQNAAKKENVGFKKLIINTVRGTRWIPEREYDDEDMDDEEEMGEHDEE